MIGTVPMRHLAPLDYRYAFDAAMPLLAGKSAIVRCGVPQLAAEAGQRISRPVDSNAQAALWIEPLVQNWQADLAALGSLLPHRAPLVVIASRPLARLVPERQVWAGRPMGMLPGGIGRLRRHMRRADFVIETVYGVHTAFAMTLSVLAGQIERLGRPDLGDRFHFAARLHYCTTGPLATLSTVALLFARKEHS